MTDLGKTADIATPDAIRTRAPASVEDVADYAVIDSFWAAAEVLGPEEARRLRYTAAEVDRMLDDDVSAVTIWRERAGMTGRQLAAAANISPSFLSEIEKGRKTGSVGAIRSLARVLRVPMEHLVGRL